MGIDPILFAILSAAVITAVIVLLYRLSGREERACPQCDHKPVRQISEEPIEVGYYERLNGGFGGGQPDIVTTFKRKYRCPACSHVWTRTEKDWNH